MSARMEWLTSVERVTVAINRYEEAMAELTEALRRERLCREALAVETASRARTGEHDA